MVTIIICLLITGIVLKNGTAQNLLLMLCGLLFALYPLATLV